MKYVKIFEWFNKKEDLEINLKKYGVTNYTINDDYTIDVDGDVNLSNRKLNKLPFKFGKVTGNFYCDDNGLESLDGCPYYVGGNFSCSGNKFTDLVGSPSDVGGFFNCQYNDNLTSLDGMSLEIGGSFNCRNNPNLTELDSISNIEKILYCNYSVDISKFRGYCKMIRIFKYVDGTHTHKNVYLN
jgi:hypothetical protein